MRQSYPLVVNPPATTVHSSKSLYLVSFEDIAITMGAASQVFLELSRMLTQIVSMANLDEVE